MSFRANDCQQISLLDSFSGLTTREQKALENSWAKVFADEIFPKIDEERFSVLYSNKASRPNTPVNVIIGALIIGMLNNILTLLDVSTYYQTVIKGIVILIAVMIDAKSN